MEVYVFCIVVFGSVLSHFEIFERIFCHPSGLDGFFNLIHQFFHRSDAYFFCTIFCSPDGQRCTPVTAAAQIPVLQIFEPFPEPAGSGRLRFPVDGVVECYHLLAAGCAFYKPAVKRVIKHRFIRSPAVWITVNVFFNFKSQSLLFQHNCQINIQSRLRLPRRGRV